ncbi:MAG TPA: hypothetical protein VGV67_09935 [Solirubrobacteraceae bacterium]|nr:hypothetical protein [Solirubrobacteraceae bacterium]
MHRILVILALCLCVPATAIAAYSKGAWNGTGKVPGAKDAKDRTVRLAANVARRECKKLTGMDATGNPETKQVRGTCFAFRGRSSYQVTCTFASGAPDIEETVTPPSDYVIGKGGAYSVSERSKSTNPQATRDVTNSVSITLRGKRATGAATYRSRQSSLAGDVTCAGRMNITLRHR